MNSKHKITTIAFVVAASLSMGAMAKGRPDPTPSPTPEPAQEQQEALSSATVSDAQISLGNGLEQLGTNNNAGANNAISDGSGNAGVNVVAGDTNQQANALAISTADADADFVFGAVASVGVLQVNGGNSLSNQDVHNTAKVDNVANGYSGNLGLNVAAGGFNQQKNDAAIANASQAHDAEASIEMMQVAVVGTTYNGVETDALAAVATGWTPRPTPDPTPAPAPAPTRNIDVKNNANLVSSLNGFSGNAGVNVAAGGANQQSNSLSIAAGCTGCP